jgi:hypothetical protein
MKTVSSACLVAAALFVGHLGLTAAEAAKFRYLTSVYVDDKAVGFSKPEGIACNGKGQVVVGDTGNDRLVRFTYQDKTVSGTSVIKIPQLLAPARVHLNSKGDIYALDARKRRIVHLGPAGDFKDTLAFDGVPAPATIVPKSFTIDSADNIYVLDEFSARVLALSAQGKFQRALAFPDDAGFITDLAVDFSGNVLLLDSVKRRLYSAAKDAKGFTRLGSDMTEPLATMPTYLTASKGTIFVVEGNGSSIVVVGRDGSFLTRQLTMGWEEGQLNHPSQICLDDRDEVFVADTDNSRVQVFQLVR